VESDSNVTLAETLRTRIRLLTAADAPFIRDLLNQPSFLRYIGDRQVRTDDEAGHFIDARYMQSYRDHGFGLWVVESRETGEPMGICGFVRRETLPDADMGFAFLPQFEGQGFAFEAADAALRYGRGTLGLTRVLAIAQMDNARSHTLLTRLGFQFDSLLTLPGENEPLSLFVSHV
jgi:[ribosomal protein S5]-alanine N-acetyltransferase